VMAHWHDFNPWAAELVYLPSLEEAALCCEGGMISVDDKSVPYDVQFIVTHWLHQSVLCETAGKLDAYLLRDGPLSKGERYMHLGVRWGKEPEEYFSPHVCHQEYALMLYLKYGGPHE
jgi:hypothetical protein